MKTKTATLTPKKKNTNFFTHLTQGILNNNDLANIRGGGPQGQEGPPGDGELPIDD